MSATATAARTRHKTVEVDGLEIFYREGGDPANPAVLLLHGFPTSSFMFRNLIPALADEFHLVAPDYPSYGQSSFPAKHEFDYTGVCDLGAGPAVTEGCLRERALARRMTHARGIPGRPLIDAERTIAWG